MIEIQKEISKNLGAEPLDIYDHITLYLPNKDRKGNPFPNYNEWVKIFSDVITKLCGGCTFFRSNGRWLSEDGTIINEHTTLFYSYIMDVERFFNTIVELKIVINQFMEETNQEAVAYSLNKGFYIIKSK